MKTHKFGDRLQWTVQIQSFDAQRVHMTVSSGEFKFQLSGEFVDGELSIDDTMELIDHGAEIGEMSSLSFLRLLNFDIDQALDEVNEELVEISEEIDQGFENAMNANYDYRRKI